MTEVMSASPAPSSAGDVTSTEQEIIRISEEVLQRDGIKPEDDLFDLGVTSLAFIRILVRIHEKFGVAFTGAELGDDASIAHLSATVDEARTA
ncbi:hypothetical protein ACTI_45460 [Actinoplanes sp. OR16]|uniref:acyl carrier protein n=1 Tax=Actinoplanes sp. OR16 TaxID=946334 RepID=UPI000F6C85E9|nr:acyl carrier protein [Actinoplanes sp. OR16]BBH67861.1 hypothetical protein ACTI_45460 [Actinoplanes sp. OR16]